MNIEDIVGGRVVSVDINTATANIQIEVDGETRELSITAHGQDEVFLSCPDIWKLIDHEINGVSVGEVWLSIQVESEETFSAIGGEPFISYVLI